MLPLATLLYTDVEEDTKEKPFSCKLCDQSFSRTDLLRRHEKKSHPSRLTARITRPGVASPQRREIRIVGDSQEWRKQR